MPVPVPVVSEAPQWLINLSVVLAAIATAVTGWIFKRKEARSEEPPRTSGIAVVGGAFANERLMERLCDQLAHVERATRDGERATIDNTREVERATEQMSDVRRAVEIRNRMAEQTEVGISAALAALNNVPGTKGGDA